MPNYNFYCHFNHIMYCNAMSLLNTSQVGVDALGVGYPHYLGRGVGVIEGGLGLELGGLLVERHDLDAVVVLLHEGAQRQPEPLVRPQAPVHRVDRPGRLVLVDLLPLCLVPVDMVAR